ncbi:hypothetical protein [Falsiroseomonas tokyonensis]|uniref:hypothetical protein n=1 Tax=Falsiroseomonas tokyonensis TaxID=430521 RepID=UPI001C207085|nr:hypothetical protein [Falsiroseomonas tokyonensis]
MIGALQIPEVPSDTGNSHGSAQHGAGAYFVRSVGRAVNGQHRLTRRHGRRNPVATRIQQGLCGSEPMPSRHKPGDRTEAEKDQRLPRYAGVQRQGSEHRLQAVARRVRHLQHREAGTQKLVRVEAGAAIGPVISVQDHDSRGPPVWRASGKHQGSDRPRDFEQLSLLERLRRSLTRPCGLGQQQDQREGANRRDK